MTDSGLPKDVTRDWPNWAILLWGRIDHVERRLGKLYTMILVLGAVVSAVLLLTSDSSSIIGRLLTLQTPQGPQ